MDQRVRTRPRCVICGYVMIERELGAEHRHLPTEFVCRNFDCLDFGISKAMPTP